MASSDRPSDKRTGSHFSSPNGPAAGAPADSELHTGAISPHAVRARGLSSRTAAATKRAGSHSVQRGEKSAKSGLVAGAIAGVVVGVALIALLAVVVVPRLFGNNASTSGDTQEVVAGNQVTISVPDGSGADVVAQLLYDNGVIASKSEFLATVRRTQTEASLKSGAYTLVTGDSLENIVNLLTTGPNAMAGALTVPEGYTISQIAAAVEQTLGISADDFTAQAKASNYAADYPFLADVSNDSLEGYLFPKTYSFPDEGVTADTVIRAMLDQYQTEVAGIDFDAAVAAIQERYGVSVNEDDIVTMASVIEREAANDDQRTTVASVFYNRLEDNMMLQSDATLVYELGRQVTADDLKVDSDYNTYTRYGLPPTPICSPSLSSIQAAAYPADTEYLYFYLDGDYSAFSVTYDEHMAAIANRPQ